jgi:putative FmdB family regulatory protein
LPIYEYRCGGCRSQFSLLVGVVAGTGDPQCPKCGGAELQKLISRFAFARSEDDMLEDLADPTKMGDLENPRDMMRWMKQMGKEMGEDMGDDWEELVEEAIREEEQGGEMGGMDEGDDYAPPPPAPSDTSPTDGED